MKNKAKQCVCGQWHQSKSESCPSCRNLGKTKHPLHKTWTVHYRHLWPEFLDFIREVGEPPTPGHRLAGAIEEHLWGLAMSKVRKMQLEKIQLEDLTNLEPMIFDDELKHLAIQAYTEQHENPATELIHLNNIEREHQALIDGAEDVEKLQRELETMSQEYLAQIRKEREARMAHKGRGSQVRVGNAIRAKLVPLCLFDSKLRSRR